MTRSPARSAFEMRTQIVAAAVEGSATQVASDLASHTNEGLGNAHVIANIVGLTDELADRYLKTEVDPLLDAKQDTLIGYTGSITIIDSVDFSGSTTTSKTLTFSNGVLTSVV